jgi:di/tricarboxylate transporter
MAMPWEVWMTLGILAGAVLLFVTGWVRADLVALVVLVLLVVAGLVTPEQALAGFSSPAVVTLWAMFVLSAALAGTGMARLVGRGMQALAGGGEVRLMLVVMGTAVLLAAFMNSLAVLALLLPLVLSLARQKSVSSVRLLMPLAVGCLVGGLSTLIGAPSNLLVSDALYFAGLRPLGMWDFLPVGLSISVACVLFMALVGRRWLPRERAEVAVAREPEADLLNLFQLDEQLALITLPPNTPLAGRTIAECQIGRLLGLTLLELKRGGRKRIPIEPETMLQGGDELLTLGRLDRLQEISQRPYVLVDEGSERIQLLVSAEIGLAELRIVADSPLVGATIAQAAMRQKYGCSALAVRRKQVLHYADLQDWVLQADDELLLRGDRARLLAGRLAPAFRGKLNPFAEETAVAAKYRLRDRLLTIQIPPDSPLIEHPLSGSHLSELYGLMVMSVVRGETTILEPEPDWVLQAQDLLLVKGDPEQLAVIRGLQSLTVTPYEGDDEAVLLARGVGVAEVLLSPHTTLAGKTLSEIGFRERFGLSVLAIWRNGRAEQTDLAQRPLQLGDALLVRGAPEALHRLRREPDFLVLAEGMDEAQPRYKALVAVGIMGLFVVVVTLGWLALPIAAVAAAALMVLLRCLTMDEMYRRIEWRTVFMVAGMLPLGVALQTSGTVAFLVAAAVEAAGMWSPVGLLAGLFVLTSLGALLMPNLVVTIVMAPVALQTAVTLQLSPYPLLMVITMAASTSFMSPLGHPVNRLVMGPGGYRTADFMKVGIPLTLVALVVTLVVLPIFWPLRP